MSDSKKPGISPNTPRPQTHSGKGSLTNMPTPEEIAHWNQYEKPKLVGSIVQNWNRIRAVARSLNGKIRLNDQMSNS